MMESMSNRGKPRLERRNAEKNFKYDPSPFSSSTDDSSSPSSLQTRLLELNDRTSFRIEGNDGEFDRICRSLGLTGIDDFAIPPKVWQSSKIRSSLDSAPQSRLSRLNSPNKQENEVPPVELRQNESAELAKATETMGVSEFGPGNRYMDRDRDQGRDRIGMREVTESAPKILVEPYQINFAAREFGGINGVRPSVLKPPPSMTLPVVDKDSSTWDIYRGFAPESKTNQQVSVVISYSDEEDDRDVQVDRLSDEAGEAREEQDLYPLSNDDDTSSSTTEPTNISPDGRIKRTIRNWQKGMLLGSGSFGSVYEGIAE